MSPTNEGSQEPSEEQSSAPSSTTSSTGSPFGKFLTNPVFAVALLALIVAVPVSAHLISSGSGGGGKEAARGAAPGPAYDVARPSGEEGGALPGGAAVPNGIECAYLEGQELEACRTGGGGGYADEPMTRAQAEGAARLAASNVAHRRGLAIPPEQWTAICELESPATNLWSCQVEDQGSQCTGTLVAYREGTPWTFERRIHCRQ